MRKILRVLKRGVMSGMGKEKLSEEDIKARYITPAVEQSGWDKKQIRYEYAFTAGRIILSRSEQIICYSISLIFH